MPLDREETGFKELELNITHLREGLLVFAVGVIFFEEELGIFLPMPGGALTIVGAERYSSGKEVAKSAMERSSEFQRCLDLAARYEPKGSGRSPSLFLPPEQQAAMDIQRLRYRQSVWLKQISKYRNG